MTKALNNSHLIKDGHVPPRLFVLVPQHSNKAVIIVRKTSKLTGMIAWDTNSDDIRFSQWLKGRIYEYFSDISADAEYLIYSANKKGEGYTVLSRAPWLKAIALWHNVGGFGGGLFLKGQQYQLYDGSEGYCQFKQTSLNATTNPKSLTVGVYPERLVRLGWRIQSGTDVIVFNRNFGGYTIEKTWQRLSNNTIGRGLLSETHRILSSDGAIDCPDWEWCDVVGERLIWAEKGCLFSTSLDAFNIDKPHLIFDFRLIFFQSQEAPY